MTSIFLIRHGENVDGKIDDKGPNVDLGLSAAGQAQTERLCRRLQSSKQLNVQAILTSPERRAAETARRIAATLELPERASPQFEEWRSDDGSIEPEEFMSRWKALPEAERAHYRILPNSETQAEFFVRVGSALQTVANQFKDQSVAVVTHGGVIQAAFHHFFGFGDAAFRRAYPAATHTSISHWRLESGSNRWALEFSNDASHLRDV